MFKAIVKVTLKKKILDPQGKAVESGLHNLGFPKLSGVRTGKNIEMSIDEADLEHASTLVQSACGKFLANPVTEDYEFDIYDGTGISVLHFSSQGKVGAVRETVG